MRIFSSIDGIRTEGDCKPSRSVSSLSVTGSSAEASASTWFQS